MACFTGCENVSILMLAFVYGIDLHSPVCSYDSCSRLVLADFSCVLPIPRGSREFVPFGTVNIICALAQPCQDAQGYFKYGTFLFPGRGWRTCPSTHVGTHAGLCRSHSRQQCYRRLYRCCGLEIGGLLQDGSELVVTLLLLLSGATRDSRDKDGLTPVHWASHEVPISLTIPGSRLSAFCFCLF